MSIFLRPDQLQKIPLFRRLDSSFSSRRIWSRSETKIWTANFFLGTCVLYASRVALPICAVAMAQEYGWNKTDSGTILSCFFWGYAFTQLIAGSVADLVGGENILPISTLIWSLLTLLTPQLFDIAYWTNSPLLTLLFVRIFTGVGQGFHLPSMASMISRHLTSSEKGRVFGICLAGSHLGSVVAGGVGSVLLEWFGWRSLFHFVGFLSIAWCLLFNYLSKDFLPTRRSNVVFDSASKLIEKEEACQNSEKTNSKTSSSTDAMSSKNESAAVPWAKLLRHPSFWAASTAQYCGANAYFTMFSWLPSYFSDNFPQAKAYVYNVVPSMAIVLVSLLSPMFASRMLAKGKSITVTRRFMECCSLMGMALCFSLVSFLPDSFPSSLALFTVAMAIRGLHHGGVAVNPTDFAPNHTGSVFGVFNAFSAITGFIGVYFAGWILQMTNNNWAVVFSFTAVQCVIGALVYGTMGTGQRII
uniref:MFS domain-containing protein n=1 Tax=Globodera pallida TaxID=36090 RepID=A0A183BNM0_GLOPA